MILRYMLRLVGVVVWGSVVAWAGETNRPGGAVLGWVWFEGAREEYRGTRYLWLAEGNIGLTIEAEPMGGQVIEMLWGAKGDEREAVVSINGKEQVVRKGGYDGFEWVRVAVPEGVVGKKYEVVLRATGVGRAAFVGEVRLVDPKAVGEGQPAKIAYAIVAGGGEAFADMRAVWDRERVGGKKLAEERLEGLFMGAERNGRLAGEAFYRCRKFVEGWLAHADAKTGLIPRNLTVSKDLWNGRDSAADNYPFMVLTCALTDRGMFEGRMKEMLAAEMRVTKRVDRLPDDYLFSKGVFAREPFNLEATIFDSSEYVKDGLLPLTEWLGRSAWSERMIGIADDIWKHAEVQTAYGKVPTLNFEADGNLLQAGARLYWFTGERKYLEWAIRLGDYYLLGGHHPTRDLPALRLIDHGCEMVNGLSELYVAVSVAEPRKREEYRKPIHEMLDRILEVGRNEDGMLYCQMNKDGGHSKDLCDTWGYDYDAIYTVYLLDKTEAYREAVRKALGNLKGKYVGAAWADTSADGYADSIEGAINLLNREYVDSAAEWVDSQTRMMWSIQKRDGIIEGWHGDGNFARTSIMYALWKTQGMQVEPWRADVRVGAVRDGGCVCVSLSADQGWKGKVVFDRPRHKVNMRLPLDYPRINQFAEWFVVEEGGRYGVKDVVSGKQRVVSGKEMAEGVEVELKAGEEMRWRVEAVGG
ncbi:MAG: hypothetical protein NTU53_02625 [Planctomycetota bacterium]|nr:hypothetical protein [Planctomycetota bacterium]